LIIVSFICYTPKSMAMQLRRRPKKNEATLKYKKSTDIEFGSKMKYEKKHVLRMENNGSFHRWQRFIMGTDRLTVFMMVFGAFFFRSGYRSVFIRHKGKKN